MYFTMMQIEIHSNFCLFYYNVMNIVKIVIFYS